VKKQSLRPKSDSRVYLVLELVHVTTNDTKRVDLLVSTPGSEDVIRHSWPLQVGPLWESQLADILAVAGQHITAQSISFVGVQTVLEV